MARRGENVHHRKDGRWEGRYIKGRKPDRTPIYGFVYARKYSECKEKLTHAKLMYINEGEAIKTCGSGTVADFLTYWLYSIEQPLVKSSTFSNYAGILNKWLLPLLGMIKLHRLGIEEVQRFVNMLSEQNLAAGTVRNIFRILFSAMKKAKDYGYIYRNPCEGIRLPEIERKEARLLTLQEQKKLEQTARTDLNGFAVLLAMYTGLRVGELCALRWKDVDLDMATLRVSQTRQRVQCFDANAETKTVLITGSAKSNKSSRIIPLPACITKRFVEYGKLSNGEYIFAYHGQPLEPRVMQYRFKALLKKADIADINFHALRHTFATRCMEMNFDIKTLSDILGHASAKMTLDKYGHSQLEHKRSAMQSLDNLFGIPV